MLGYNYVRYLTMKEVGVAEFLSPQFPRTEKEYLVRGRIECEDPVAVSSIQSHAHGEAYFPVIYSHYTIKTFYQSGRKETNLTEVQYVLLTQRDFHLRESEARLEVQPDSETQFLPCHSFMETTTKNTGFWGILKRVLIGLVNLLVFGSIEYETAQQYASRRRAEHLVPVGASVCVAGKLVLSGPEPSLLSTFVALNKAAITARFRSPFVYLAVAQLVCGGVAIVAGWMLWRARGRQKAQQRRYEKTKAEEEVKPGRECKICLTNQIDVIFEPCRHMCSCQPCAAQLRVCPICRSAIVDKTRVVIS